MLGIQGRNLVQKPGDNQQVGAAAGAEVAGDTLAVKFMQMPEIGRLTNPALPEQRLGVLF